MHNITYSKTFLKMGEFVHRTQMPLLPANVYRGITPALNKWSSSIDGS